MTAWWALWPLWGSAAALLAWTQARWVVPRLREPADGAPLGKIAYRTLPTRGRLVGIAAVAAASQLATAFVPASQRGLWLVLGSGVLVLVWVDAVTTWVPAALVRSALTQLVAAGAVGLVWDPAPAHLIARMALAGAASWGLWWLMWRITRGGLGFGDVRLATLIGIVMGTYSWTLWLAAWLAGSLVGALWGLLRRRAAPAPGTTSGFAYGPALWLGPYAALLWLAWV